jgi:hypothetical protein
MTIVFMPLVSALIAEHVNPKLSFWLLPILTAVGVGSVMQWHFSVERGAGDLRFFGAVQLYAVLALFLVLFLPPCYTRGSDLLVVAGLYVLAKVCETADRQIFSLGHLASGHTLKHLASGLAGFWIWRMLQKRQPIAPHSNAGNDAAANDGSDRRPFESAAIKRGITGFALRFFHMVSPGVIR